MRKVSKRGSAVDGVLGEPRGRILNELCGHPQTAVELATRVGTSSNAVRVHLDGLRDSGLVDYQIARRGVGKPTHVYSLTAAAESLLSAAYAPTLRAVVESIERRLNGQFIPALRDAGEALASEFEPPSAKASTRRRVDSARAVMETLGTRATITTRDKEYLLVNACCPLSALTRDTPQICQLMEALLERTSGLEVDECCERSEHPRCSFTLRSPAP